MTGVHPVGTNPRQGQIFQLRFSLGWVVDSEFDFNVHPLLLS